MVGQIVVSVALIASVAVQVKGVGFGRVWGSGGTSFTRRGLEKLIFKGTFVLSFLFITLSALALLV